MSRIFINYRRQDSEGYVGRLYDHLSKHFDRADIFMDVDSIRPGADFVQVLEEAVAGCDLLIAVIGPQWVSVRDDRGDRRLDQWNDFVRIEIESALRNDKIIIPVLVGGAKMPAPGDLPETIRALARRNAFELSHIRFSYDVDKLVETIRNTLPAHPALKIAADSETTRRKADALKQVRLELIGDTRSPLHHIRTTFNYLPVLGEGNPDANILFIGESPGKNEAEVGRPFIGPSGEVFSDLLRAINLRREDVFVTNLLLDYPGEKRTPLPEEIAYYTPFVDRILDIIRPAVIATLGRFAMEYMFKKLNLSRTTPKMKDHHGKLLKVQLDYGEVFVMPLYHPASVLYEPSQKDTLRKDFEKLRVFI